MISARNIVIYFYEKNNGVWEDIYNDIKEKTPVNEEDMKDIDFDSYITIVDNNYPEELKQAHKPPFCYKKGQDIVNYMGINYERDNLYDILEDKVKKTINLMQATKDPIERQGLVDELNYINDNQIDLKNGKHLIGY